MAAALGFFGGFILDQTGQAAQIRQNHVQQKESLFWVKRNYHLDAQSLLLDALDHSKEEIRCHYETYAHRIDTPVLVLALIWPFALNTIQFSDPFVPGLLDGHPSIEATHRILVFIWVALLGTILILPFWGILMLIRTKLKLDSWLEYCLAGLSRERREIMTRAQEKREEAIAGGQADSADVLDSQEIVAHLVDSVIGYQEYLARIWTAECGWLVHASTMLLWMSAVGALLLVSLSCFIFFWDKGGVFRSSSPYFLGLIGFGVIVPAFHVILQRLLNPVLPPENEPDEMIEATFPLTSFRAQEAPQSRRIPEGAPLPLADSSGEGAQPAMARGANHTHPVSQVMASLGARSPRNSS